MSPRLLISGATVTLALLAAWVGVDRVARPPDQPVQDKSSSTAFRPVKNNCKGGTVTLTFDDGPYVYTDSVVSRLEELNMHAVFFMIGSRAVDRKATVTHVLKAGNVVANHTFNHLDLTTGGAPEAVPPIPPRPGWGEQDVRDELQRGGDALVQVGAPRPTLYRPPYGSVNPKVDAVAKGLGLRLVESWDSGNIIDSRDTEGIGAARIVKNVTGRLRPGSLIVMHDGAEQSTLDAIGALQPIADALNARHLCTSKQIH